MAEKQKESAASTKSKEKTSLLDLDMGKDFLTSWKSMSVAEDDPMDFDFSSVAKGKKKAFNFNNVDMDFNLDADFGKISSFKVDISDLDVSSPVKKAGKPNEKSKEVSTDGKAQGKSDKLTFQFDFNEFDDLNFGSSPVKKAKQTKSNQDAGKSSSISGSLGSGFNLKENIGTSEGETTSKFDGQHAGERNSSFKDKSPASFTDVHFPSKSDKFKDQATELVATTSPEKPTSNSTQETYQEICSQEKIILTESYAKESCHNLSVQSESENSSTHETAAANSHEGVRCLAQRESSGTCGELNIYDEKPESSFNCGNSKLDQLPADMACSQSNNSETMRCAGNTPVEIGYKDDVEPTQGESQFEQSFPRSVSRESLHESETDGKSLDLTSELVAPQLNCENTSETEKEIPAKGVTEVVRSKYFKGSDETKSQLQQSSLSQINATTSGSRRLETVQPSPANEGPCSGIMGHKAMPAKEYVPNFRSQNLKGLVEAKSQLQQSSLSQMKLGTIGSKKISSVQLSTAHDRKLDNKDVPSGSNLVSLPRALPREQTKGGTGQIKCQGSPKDFSSNREGFNLDSTVRTLIGTSRRVHDKDAEKGELVRNGNDNIKDLNTFRNLENKDAQSKSKLVSLPSALAKEKSKGDSVETTSQGRPKDVNSNREGFNPDSTARTLIDTSRVHDKDAEKGELVRNRNDNIKDLNTFRNLENKDAQSKSKLVFLLSALAKEKSKGDSVETRSQGSPKDVNSNREGFHCYNTGRMLTGTSRLHDKEVAKGELVLNRTENNMKDLNTFSSLVRPSSLNELTNKSASLVGLNPRLSVSSHNKDISFSLNKKISNIKDGVQTSVLSNLNNMRIEEPIHPPSTFKLQKDIKSITNSGQSVDLKDNTLFRMTQFADTRKLTSSSPTMKRKMTEESRANMLILKPPTRVTESPSKRRNVVVSPEKIAENENMIDGSTDNVLNNSQSYSLHTPQKVNMKELEAPFTIYNDTNVENAEACAKELDNLANMLKKKHEEAKEILVRAVVNNNKLLMLDHPAYEEKIRMIEKFGAMLLSK